MLLLVGVNHKSAPLPVRERLAFHETELPAILKKLTKGEHVREAMILSTCNRVEIVAHVDDTHTGLTELQDFLVAERSVSSADLDRYGYRYFGVEAARHLFRVASGLDSMILGEPQILGQVKQAYAMARNAGTIGSILDRLMRRCFACSKKIRTETGISRHAVSIAFAAVQLARKIFGELQGHRVLLLGAGKMGGLLATHLVAKGVDSLTVASRSYSRASTFAEGFGGEACNWDDSFRLLEKVDIVVCGTAAPGTILDKKTVQAAVRKRRSKPLFIIDIAVPRDVEEDVNQIDNVYLYDIDDLQGVVDSNLSEREREAAAAERMVLQEGARFERWLGSLQVTPTIVALRDLLHGIGSDELEKFLGRQADLTERQQEQIGKLVRQLIQKILHQPIKHLKGAAERGEAPAASELYLEIFGLDSPEDESEEN